MFDGFFRIDDKRTATVRAAIAALVIAYFAVSSARLFFGMTMPNVTSAIGPVIEVYAFAFAVLFGFPIMLVIADAFRRSHTQIVALQERADTDGLTGLFNRDAFHSRIEAYQLGKQTEGGASNDALLIIDADNFKAINDTYGHTAGDAALKMIALCIDGNCFERDLVARLGGEEFAVFLKNAGQEGAHLAAERIRQAVEANTAHFQRQSIRVTVSIGATPFPINASFEEAYRAADALLYQAKNAGRNRVEISPFMNRRPMLRAVS
mgnify:CR=1 FL=1